VIHAFSSGYCYYYCYCGKDYGEVTQIFAAALYIVDRIEVIEASDNGCGTLE